MRSIHVVAGVITDARGRVLLTRRTETRDMPGLWEFPGGKREHGETSEQALARELGEELGIQAEVGQWLIEVPQLYPDKRLRLEVRRITSWKGAPRGREGQALTWVAPEKLGRYSMPPADLPVVAMLRQPEHYWISAEPCGDMQQWFGCVEQAISDGVQRILLRAGQLERDDLCALAQEVIRRCGKKPVQLLLERDIALASELHIGVHLAAWQLVGLNERPLPTGLPVAACCGDLADLRAAQNLACDFVVYGSVQSAADQVQADVQDWQKLQILREQVWLPIYLLGTPTTEQLQLARHYGLQGIAELCKMPALEYPALCG
jgi:8-oxo-dGTP diphosphatase